MAGRNQRYTLVVVQGETRVYSAQIRFAAMNTAATLSLASALAMLCVFSVHSLPATLDTRDTVEMQVNTQTSKNLLNSRARRSISECAPYLLVSTWYDGIYRMNLDGSNVQQVLTSADTGESVIGLAVDYNGGYMYFASFNSYFLKRSKLDGSEVTTISTCYYCYRGIEFDWMNNKLYLTNENKIEVYDPATGVITPVYTSGSRIWDIALDPPNGKMYWVDWGLDIIYGAESDGSSSFTIQGSGLDWPNGIALDPSSQRLYWTDGRLDKIESSHTDGSDRMTHISSVDVEDAFFFKDTLYYVKWNPHEARALDPYSGATTALASLDLPLEVTVVAPPPGDECVDSVYVMAHTSLESAHAGTDQTHNVEIGLSSGATYTASLRDLPGDQADPGKGDLWKLSLASDFGVPQGTCVEEGDIVSIAVVEDGNDGWMIDSIITLLQDFNNYACSTFEVATVDMDVHRWVDGNGASGTERFDMTSPGTLTASDCVDSIYVMAHTSTESAHAGTDQTHNVEIALSSGATYTASLRDLPGDQADPGKSDLYKLTIEGDFGIPQGTCINKGDIVSMAVLEDGNDGWLIESIVTILRASSSYEVATVDMDVHYWIDGNASPSQTTLDATRFDLTIVLE